MEDVKKKRTFWRWGLYLLLTPILLFLLIGILVYIPPIQQFLVDQVAKGLTEQTGVDMKVEKIRLAFPLDLAVHRVTAIEKTDTLADIRAIRLKVRLWPLTKGMVEVDGLEVFDAKVNSGNWIPDVYLRGNIHKFSAATHGIDLKKELINLDYAIVDGAELFVALSDTATETSPTAPTKWNILADKLELTKTDVRLSLPGDSIRVGFCVEEIFLNKGQIDFGKSDYFVEDLKLESGDLTYAVRTILNDTTLSDSLFSDSKLCGENGNLAFSDSDSLLWKNFVPKSKGLDPNYVVLHRVFFHLADLGICHDGTMGMNIKNFFLRERGGAQIDQVGGKVFLDNGVLGIQNFSLRTPTSTIGFDSELHLDSILSGTNDYGTFRMQGEISAEDVKTLACGYVDDGILSRWPDSPLKLKFSGYGLQRSLAIDSFLLDWSRVARIQLKGEMLQPYSDQRMGNVDFDLRTYDLSFLHHLLSMEGITLGLPQGLTFSGKARMNADNYWLDSRARSVGGQLQLNAKLNVATESYQAQLVSDRFPLRTFMSSAGPVSGTVSASGHGFDIFRETTDLQAEIKLDTLTWDSLQLGKISLNANLAKCDGVLDIVAENDIFEGEGRLSAHLGEIIDLKLKMDVPNVSLSTLMEDKDRPLSLGTELDIDAYSDQDFSNFGISGSFKNVRFITKDMGIPVRDIYYSFDSSPDTTLMSASSGDMEMSLAAAGNVERISSDVMSFLLALEQQAQSKKLNQTALKEVVPRLDFRLKTGHVNPVVNMFREMGYAYRMLDMDLSVSPENGVKGDFSLSAFSTGDLVLDTVKVHLQQDTTGLVADAWVKNFHKTNKTKFEGSLKSYLLDTGAGLELNVKNKDGIVGLNFGLLADIADTGIKIHLYPEKPVLAFRNFTVNPDNFVFFGKGETLRADVNLLADDGTGLRIYSQPSDSLNDLTVSLDYFDLSTLSGVLPYLPKMRGILNGDFHLIDDHQSLSAMASIAADQFILEEAPLGDIGMELVYLPLDSTMHQANIFVSSDDTEILSLGGLYNSDPENESFEGTADLLDFPLELLNGFLVGTDLSMSGKAAGHLMVNGNMNKPTLNGNLQFNQAHLYSEVYGFDFRMDEQKVNIVDNQMVLENYALHSNQGNNPLLLNGSLDMRDFSDIKMDFSMSTKNFELINAKKQAKSLVFGKVYADFDATMKGSLDDLSIRGKLSILDRTDMTYILKDSPLTVDDRLHDLVQFVDFEESPEAEAPAVAPSSNFDMTLSIGISDAALFHCNLSEDGSNYVDLEGGGDLILRLTQQGDMRLTGRFTATSGEMKYSLPVIPLKTFKLVRGSYVDFTGDVENPTLSIAAKERVKAMVTENDQPRSVAFDVGVSITQPLDRMGLEFTIEAPEDLTVQNQLAAMSKADRGKTAVGMLATGMYLTNEGLNSSTSGFKASNALTAFLQSEIQNIAGSALKTIDLTIGMENNTSITGSTTTDYSFQFAKRFWGNRISVIVGGKVSTGAEADNSAESFIDNIAVEYRLDKTASRYVRVFYERSFQDPLEGQLTKTGAGLVLRRKSDRLGDLFIFRNRDTKKKREQKRNEK